MLADHRPMFQRLFAPFGSVSARLGLTADFWTWTSLVLSVAAGYALWQRWWIVGLVLTFLVNLADAIDGATARATGTGSSFGTMLDHNVDRYAEFLLFGGLLLSGHVPAWLVYAAVFGMLMASYVRSKVESLSDLDLSTIGLGGRAEKQILFGCGLGLEGIFGVPHAIAVTVAVVGLLSHITFFQRLLYARRHMRGRGGA